METWAKTEVKRVMDTILHNQSGLRQYRFKNSHIKPVGHTEPMKGSIFAFGSKELMTQSRGVILTSLESLNDHVDSFSHWTPNVFCYGKYADNKRRWWRATVKPTYGKLIRLLWILMTKSSLIASCC